MMIPSGKKCISLILKMIVVISAAAGVFLSAYATRDTFMGGRVVFMYFTIQSNIAIALLALAGVFLLLKGSVGNAVWQVVMLVGTVSITLTGTVFCFVLAPTLGKAAWNLQNILTHVVVPVAAILDFIMMGVYGDIKRKNVVYVIIPPLLYAVYAGIGYAAGWEFSAGINYPYFFLNWGSPAGAFGFTDDLPYMGCMWWIIALFLLLIAVGHLYLSIIKKLKNK